jgi:hypothetical protein
MGEVRGDYSIGAGAPQANYGATYFLVSLL